MGWCTGTPQARRASEELHVGLVVPRGLDQPIPRLCRSGCSCLRKDRLRKSQRQSAVNAGGRVPGPVPPARSRRRGCIRGRKGISGRPCRLVETWTACSGMFWKIPWRNDAMLRPCSTDGPSVPLQRRCQRTTLDICITADTAVLSQSGRLCCSSRTRQEPAAACAETGSFRPEERVAPPPCQPWHRSLVKPPVQ